MKSERFCATCLRHPCRPRHRASDLPTPVTANIATSLSMCSLQAVIAAAMSDKSPWVVSLDSRNEVDLAKASSAEANSDHITLYKVFQGLVLFFLS